MGETIASVRVEALFGAGLYPKANVGTALIASGKALLGNYHGKEFWVYEFGAMEGIRGDGICEEGLMCGYMRICYMCQEEHYR